ncbi:hypothetical protein L210DRAFT_3634363 [Boletus edulis BED1]|uniref:Uncharacterized protein n=1 Tax=Boletus edulis BED1 TaxID=1328754 RepID=A0AAD4BGU8_BOLED|nr:hypothetical protein L210DRAFT_3634363 [Boletus edulis BED1]
MAELDSHHPSRPIRKHGIPWFIEDHTGQTVGHEEIRARVFGLANGLKHRFGIKEDGVVRIISTTLLPSGQLTDWEPSCPANPLFTLDELAYQIQTIKASVIITHPEALPVALSACRTTMLPAHRIIMFNVDGASYDAHTTVQDVIDEGLASASTFQERVLQPVYPMSPSSAVSVTRSQVI